MEVKTFEHRPLVKTRWIRTHVSGPKPCNVLAFLRCKVAGMPYEYFDGELSRYRVLFTTDFAIGKYNQAQHQWYEANTLISAAAVLRTINTTTDFQFIAAVEWIAAGVREADGRLQFTIQHANLMSGGGINDSIVYHADLTAYVLLYEPRAELPPPGNFGQRVALDPIKYFPGDERELIYTDDPRLIRKSSK